MRKPCRYEQGPAAPDRLFDPHAAIERINRYTKDIDELAFMHNELGQDAVIRNLEILDEASNNIQKHYPDFAAQHSELPLAFAFQMRNAVAHGYFK